MTQCSNQNGALVLMLIAAIAVMSAFSVAMLSMSTTTTFGELNANHFNKAFYLAESGMRYAQTFGAGESGEYTFVQRDDGTFYRIANDPPPASPPFIGEAGFRISITECGIQSTGVVKENSMFEAIRTITTEERTGLPCWDFNAAFSDTDYLKDTCAENSAQENGEVWRCGAGYAGALDFDGGSHVGTTFKPYCEIGDNQSFSVAFWAMPRQGTSGTVMGVDDGGRQFAIGIDEAGRWFWAYGDRRSSEMFAAFDRWQYVTLTYDTDRNEITMGVDACGGFPESAVTAYSSGSGLLPRSVRNVFIGALNAEGVAASFFNGIVDEIVITNTPEAISTSKNPVFCIESEAVAYYPFDDAAFGTAKDKGDLGIEYSGTVFGAVPEADRFGCPDDAYSFSGNGYIGGNERYNQNNSIYPFTIVAWVRVDDQLGEEYVIFSFDHLEKLDAFGYNVQLGLYLGEVNGNRGHVCARTFRLIGDRCSAQTVDDGQWHFIAAVFHNQFDRTIYIDGAEPVDQILLPLTGGAVDALIEGWAIGRWSAEVTPGYFEGIIDDVIFFEKSLTPEEIQALALERF